MLRTGRLRRPMLLLAAVGAAVGGMLFVAGSAQAAIGTDPGALTLSPASGSTSSTPTWSTTVGCPAGYQASAVLAAVSVQTGGPEIIDISQLAGSITAPPTILLTGAFSGTPLPAIFKIQEFSAVPNGGTQELFVLCFSGVALTGASVPVMDTFITYSADGSTYTTSATPPNTTTTLTASPDPATAGQTVTLTATEVAADGTQPAGSVQFVNSSTDTDIGSPVAVNSSGVATTTTTSDEAGPETLSAWFIPANTTGYSSLVGIYTETVQLVNTTTTLIASPDQATVGQAVTLTAAEVAADGTSPAGSVQFEVGGTDIGSAVAVNSSGVATTTTTFAAPGPEVLSAVFTPTIIGYSFSEGTTIVTVLAASATSGSEPVTVTLPAAGSFTLTVATGTVTLSMSSFTAIGALNAITVSDTRNTYPGWSVSGQAADFTGSGAAAGADIPGNDLGWVPTTTGLGPGASLGPTVTPAGPGLGTTPAVLAGAGPGHGGGTSVLGANLTLDIPATAPAGPYTSSLTVTAVTSGP